MSDQLSRPLRRPLPFSYGSLVVAILLVVLVGDVVCWAAGEHLGARMVQTRANHRWWPRNHLSTGSRREGRKDARASRFLGR